MFGVFCSFPSIFHMIRCLFVIITHTPQPPLVEKIHTYMHIYIYIHKYMPSFLIPSFFFTYHLSHIFRSFTTSFIFPSFPVGTITSHKAYRKNLQNLWFHSTEHYIQVYIYIPSFHIPSFFITHGLPRNSFNFSILHHLLCLSFLPRPATIFIIHGPHTHTSHI